MDFILLIQHFFDWRALIDILLMSFGLFFLYRTLQRLGTWGVAAGILVAMVVYFLASILDLKGIEWILGNLSQVTVIALIVIFQPELRKIFERAASLRRSKKVDFDDVFTGLLVEALWSLANKRQGAIVVLPGKEPIQEWLSGGFELDAVPSTPLIMSIFDPNSSGHDGAIIVSRGKLSRFGVRLPVSQSARLPEAYGTRHHAAMGLAERSDALIIAVSEERGKISVFKEGKMLAMDQREKLSASISEHVQKTASSSLDLPQGKVHWRTVVQMSVSLGLAIFFWSTLIIAQGEILEKVLTVPLEFTASPENLVLVGDKDKDIRLHLSGPKSDLDEINPLDLSVKIDLSKAVTGKQEFVITADNLRLPRKINLLDVVPSAVELTLAEIVEQEVFIKPQLLGKLPNNMKITSMKVIPEKVKVFSPASTNKDLMLSLITTPIYLDSIYGSTSVFCKIIAPPAIQPAEKRWPDVEVMITVSQ
jgi:diadenylate cyclase